MDQDVKTATAKKAASIINDAKKNAVKILNQGGHGMLAITVSSNLEQVINRLNFITGTSMRGEKAPKFKPVTNFMGEDITLPTPIKEEDLSPDQAERKAFLDKVEKLYKQFDTIPPEGILKDYTLPEDVLVIRGVAKRAGVEGYEDRPMDVAFMKDIAEGIESKAAEEAKQKEIEEELKKTGGNK
jgi:hypothetical protein